MKRKLRAIGLALLTFIIAGGVALAAYSASISITNSGSAEDMLAFNASGSFGFMADNNYFGNPEGLDTRLLEATTERKHMLADDRLMGALPFGANSSKTLSFTTNNSALDSFAIIPGYSNNSSVGFITTVDNSTLELAENASAEITGFLDGSESGNIINKALAFSLSGDGAGNYTAAIHGESGASNFTTSTNGTGTFTNITTLVGAATHWEAVNTNDGDTSYVSSTGVAELRDTYESENFTPTDIHTINSVTVYITYKSTDGINDALVRPVLYLNGSVTLGTQDNDNTGGYVTFSEALARPGGGSWSIADLNALEIGVQTASHVATTCRVTHVYAIVNYTTVINSAEVTQPSVTTGNHTLTPSITRYNHLTYNSTAYLKNPVANFRSGDSVGAIEMWINTTNLTQQVLLGSADEVSATRFIWVEVSASGNISVVQRNATGSTSVGGSTNVTDGDWHHIVVSSSGVAYTIMVDGATDALSGVNDGDWFADTANRDNLTLGMIETSGGVQLEYDGDIATTRIYSREMLVAEALTNYTNGLPAPASNTTGLVFNLPLAEGAGNPVDTVGALVMTSTQTVWNDELYLGLGLDGVVRFVEGVAVPDNTNNITFLEGNVMPYADNITITVNGTDVVWYRPITITENATLIDRAGGEHPGYITWGGNPSTLSVTMGGMVSGYEVSSLDVAGTPDVVPVVAPVTNTNDAAKEAALATDWFYPAAVAINAVTNITIITQYMMAYLMLAILVFYGAYKVVPNLAVSAAGFDIVMGVAIAKGIYDWWLIFGLILILVATTIMENKKP